MQALSVVGWSGSGKTTLLTRLIPCLIARGLRVSTIKHAHHDLALDTPGKDSARHAAAGAAEVVLTTAAGFALFSARPTALPELLARLAPVDLVLVEGFKDDALPKLEVHRPSLGKPPLWPRLDVLAVAADEPLPDCPRPVFQLDNVTEIAVFICRTLSLNRRRRDEE